MNQTNTRQQHCHETFGDIITCVLPVDNVQTTKTYPALCQVKWFVSFFTLWTDLETVIDE